MHGLAPLIYDLAIMLSAAALVTLLFQRIHQPVVLGYLVAGIIVGPYTPPHALVSDIPNLEILSGLGVIFLMFALGLDFSFHKLTRVGFSATVTGVIEVLLMMGVGFGVGQLLGWSFYDSVFLGAALSISSTTIIIKAIDELGLKSKRFAELVFGILIVEDLLAILLLVALSAFVVTQNVLSSDMFFTVIRLILVVGGWFIVGYFLTPPLFRKISPYINQETLTILAVALCLSLACIAATFNYSTALGAFIMGSILAETPLIHRIEPLILPIRDIFAAVFFISVGMLINPLVIIENWQIVILFSLVTIFGKLLITGTAAFLSGQSLQTSTRVGFSMAQVGEFSFIIAALGVSLKVTSSKLYPLIVAVSAVTTFATPYLIRLSGYVSTQLEKKLHKRTKFFLDSYSTWIYRIQTTSKQNQLFRKILIRLLVNGMIVAIIFMFAHYLVFIKLDLFAKTSWPANTLCLVAVLAIASPFIWGMLFSFKTVQMPVYAKTFLNPVVFLIWLLTLTEVMILAFIYFQSWATIAFFVIIAITFFILSFQHLEKSYHWFEKQLIANIHKAHPDDKIRYEQLAPWDTHLVEIEVVEQSAFADKTLGESKIRENFGVNIVAICHGARVIPAPRGDEKMVAQDKLIVLGNDKQIEAFTKKMTVKKELTEEMPKNFLNNFTLKALLLEKGHRLIGKTIRHSKIREQVNGLIVGLERGSRRILNPNPDMELEVDDLLLIVGEVAKMRALK